jgi:hypothetical protein
VVALFIWLSSTTQQQKESDVSTYFHRATKFEDSPTSMVISGVFIVVLYLALFVIGMPMDYLSKPIIISFIETGAWITFAIGMIFLFCNRVMDISLRKILDDWFDKYWNGKKDEVVDKAPEPVVPKPEVFNIADNVYTYDDAQTVCSAYGARLATYDEIESAYQDGAEWCNYGWSEGQMIFFPTQKKTWDALQKTKKNKHSCGRPGVNGGFIENPYAQFGINCYGIKPDPTESEKERLKETAAQPDALAPKTEEDKIRDMKIQYVKEHANNIQINSFNSANWSALKGK